MYEIEKWSEWLDVEDWKANLEQNKHDIIWDPLELLPQPVHACWVFGAESETLEFIYGIPFGKIDFLSSIDSEKNNEIEILRSSQYLFFRLIDAVHSHCDKETTDFNEVLKLYIQQNGSSDLSENELERLKWLSCNTLLSVCYSNKSTIAYCISKFDATASAETTYSDRRVRVRLEANLQRYFELNPVSKLVPSFYFDWQNSTLDQVFDKFWSPKLFHLRRANDHRGWLWPWQRCYFEENGDVKPSPLYTTSLCVDLRNSTFAMEYTEEKSSFARFIKEVTMLMRQCILSSGGYFDKETGDGVVGHFVDDEEMRGASRACLAARLIRTKMTDRCKEFVRNELRQYLVTLNVGIGIHSGPAYWFADEKQIRAIGESVVGATRICSNAPPGTILMSLSSYRSAQNCSKRKQINSTGLIDVSFKEVKTGIQAYVIE